MTQAEQAQALRDLATQAKKSKQEILDKIAALETANTNAGNTTQEQDDALADLKSTVQGIDDINPDAIIPPVEGGEPPVV